VGQKRPSPPLLNASVGYCWGAHEMKPALVALLIASCGVVAAQPEVTPIDECGFLEQVGDCIFFEPNNSWDLLVTDLAVLPDSLVYRPVRLIGDLVSCQYDCAGWTYRSCIVGTQVGTCERVDLGCGVLQEDVTDFCHVWISPVHGILPTSLYGHADGDTVRVLGVIDRSVLSTCMFGDGSLCNEVFYECVDSVDATRNITWGKLKGIFR